MAEKQNGLGAGSIVVDGEHYATDTFELDGQRYTMRELSVDEGDDIWDAAQAPVDPKNPSGPKEVNTRLNTRLLMAKALVDPVTTADQVGKWGGRKYTLMLRKFNALNAIPEDNPTPPAG